MGITICHLTTAHLMDDARIFNKECRSIARDSNFSLVIAAHGNAISEFEINMVSFGDKPKNRLLRIIKSQFLGLKMICTIKPNLWHLHDPELLPTAALLILLKRNVIWDAHEDYFLQFEPSINYRSYLPPIFRSVIAVTVLNLLKFVDENAYAVIAATSTIAARYSNSRTRIVGNEARIEEFSKAHPNFETKRILFTGPTTEAQSFKEVVAAVAAIEGLTLTLVGKQPSPDSWEYGRMMLENRIEYLGWKNRVQLASVISESTIGLITYNNNPINMTNSPNKLFEFSAAGLPCVVTPTDSNRVWAAKSGGAVLANGFNANDLAQALRFATLDKEKWKLMSENLRAWSKEEGSWDNSERSLLSIYNEALAEFDA